MLWQWVLLLFLTLSLVGSWETPFEFRAVQRCSGVMCPRNGGHLCFPETASGLLTRCLLPEVFPVPGQQQVLGQDPAGYSEKAADGTISRHGWPLS